MQQSTAIAVLATSMYRPVLFLEFVAAVEALLSSIRPELFMAQATTRVVLLFGPSPNRPCEIYDISLHADQQAECLTGAVPDAARVSVDYSRHVAVRQCCKRVA